MLVFCVRTIFFTAPGAVREATQMIFSNISAMNRIAQYDKLFGSTARTVRVSRPLRCMENR